MKKEKQAIALRYDGKTAPKVSAKGEGFVAEQIIKLAKEYKIPLRQDVELTKLLSEVKLSQEIPPKLYVAVAQLLCFLYFLNGKTPKDYR